MTKRKRAVLQNRPPHRGAGPSKPRAQETAAASAWPPPTPAITPPAVQSGDAVSAGACGIAYRRSGTVGGCRAGQRSVCSVSSSRSMATSTGGPSVHRATTR
ncbi:MAG: hypothetical protein R3F43_07970 [bacterium]